MHKRIVKKTVVLVEPEIPINFKLVKDIEAMLDIRVTCEGSRILDDSGTVRNRTIATHTSTEWTTFNLVIIHRQVSNDNRSFQVERTLIIHIGEFPLSKETLNRESVEAQ